MSLNTEDNMEAPIGYLQGLPFSSKVWLGVCCIRFGGKLL